MNKRFDMLLHSLLTMIVLVALPLNELFAQWYIVASEKHRRIMQEHFQTNVPAKQGNFATKQECEEFLNREIAFDQAQRNEHWCECEYDCGDENTTKSGNPYQQNQNNNIVPDRETQLQRSRMNDEIARRKKAQEECDEVNEKKQDLLGKLKKNKALDQLKTSSELSEQGEVNISNNQMEAGRDMSESAFSDGKIKLKRRQETNTIQVSPPKPVDSQKSLFEYIEHETRIVQNKIINVQKEKIKLLEKKNDIQKTINEQTIKIAQLKTEQLEVKDETQKEEIDSLLLMATELLQESEDLNIKADQELQEKNKLEQDNEALLNNYQDIYNKSKENPEQSEQFLKELRGDK